MKIQYDPTVDAVYISLTTSAGGVETTLIDDWVAVDIDADRRIVGFEVLEASERLDIAELKTHEFIDITVAGRVDAESGDLVIREEPLNYPTSATQ